jgi:biotin carboxylase
MTATVPRILLVMPTTTYRAEDFLAAARRLGVEVAIASDRCDVLAKESPAAARGAIPIRFEEPDAAARAIVEAARRAPFAAVIGADDPTTVIAAKAAAALGLAGNPPEAALAARDKRRLREALAAAGEPCPAFRVFPLDDDPRAAARGQPYPVVLKPAALSASQGVIRANDEAGFVAAFERIARLLRSPEVAVRRDPALSCVIAEEYLPGVEVALEGLLRRGRLHVLALFDKPDPLEGPFFEETIYVTPSRLPPEVQTEIACRAAAAARAIGLREGPIHAELRVNLGKPFDLSNQTIPGRATVIELAARSIGGLCSRTLRFGTGMSLEEVLIAHALGREADLERERRPAGVMMIPIPRAGILRRVEGIEAARGVPGVEEVTITQALETEVVPLPEGACYLGFIFARADSPEAVERALREAHGRLGFDIARTLGTIRSP